MENLALRFICMQACMRDAFETGAYRTVRRELRAPTCGRGRS